MQILLQLIFSVCDIITTVNRPVLELHFIFLSIITISVQRNRLTVHRFGLVIHLLNPRECNCRNCSAVATAAALRYTAARIKCCRSAVTAEMSPASVITFTTSHSSNCLLKTEL
jgi:hypothetical protein